MDSNLKRSNSLSLDDSAPNKRPILTRGPSVYQGAEEKVIAEVREIAVRCSCVSVCGSYRSTCCSEGSHRVAGQKLVQGVNLSRQVGPRTSRPPYKTHHVHPGASMPAVVSIHIPTEDPRWTASQCALIRTWYIIRWRLPEAPQGVVSNRPKRCSDTLGSASLHETRSCVCQAFCDTAMLEGVGNYSHHHDTSSHKFPQSTLGLPPSHTLHVGERAHRVSSAISLESPFPGGACVKPRTVQAPLVPPS